MASRAMPPFATMSQEPFSTSQSEDHAAFVQFMRGLYWFILIADLAVVLAILVSTPLDWGLYFGVGLVAMVVGASWWQLPRHPQRAVITIVVGLWCMATLIACMYSGVHTATIIVYPFPIAMAGWFLGRRWLMGLTGLTIVFVVGIGLAEHLGIFHPAPKSPAVSVMILVSAVCVVIAYLTFVARRDIGNSRDRAVRLSQALTQQASEVTLRERDLALLLKNVPAAVASMDVQSRLRSCNGRYAELFGTTPSAIIGKHIADYVPDIAMQQLGISWEAAMGGTPQNYRRFNVHPVTSAVTWVDVGLMPEQENGKVSGLYAVLVDVTDKVQAEAEIRSLNADLESRVVRRSAELAQANEKLHESREELVRSQAKATLAALIASVSHELGTPIGNSVLMASSLADLARELQHQIDTNQLKKSSLAELNRTLGEGSQLLMRNLARAQTLLQNFKQVSADQASEQRRSFDLAAVVAEVVSSLAPSLRTQPHKVVQNIAPGIVMDSLPGPLGQVVINLVNNAYLHAFEGRKDGILTISASVSESQVTLRFQDNGVGIPQEVLQHLLEPFFSTKIGRGGTGLGMSIVDSIVRKTLGGAMRVQSVVGQGATFEVELPMVAPVLGQEP